MKNYNIIPLAAAISCSMSSLCAQSIPNSLNNDKIAYIHGDVSDDGNIPSGSAPPYDQMLLDDTGSTGLSQFAASVTSSGYSIDQYYDQSITLNANFLNNFETIIFGLHQKVWSSAEVAALDTWINDGGSILIYSDSASGGRFNLVGSANPVGQTATNNIISQYGMEVTVDQAAGTVALRSGNNSHPIVDGNLIIEGEGVSPVAVDPNAGVEILIPYQSNSVVSGNASLNRTQNITINNPQWASLALKDVGNGHVVVMFDRQCIWNNGPGSDINERDNFEILNNIVDFLLEEDPSTTSGLIAHWSMNEGSGNTVADITGNGHDTTRTGASWDSDGARGSALEFESGSGGISLPVSAFSSLDEEVTIAMWVNGDSDQPVRNTNFSASAGGRALNIHLPWSNGSVYWDAGNTGSAYDRTSGSAHSSTYRNGWNHWVFTKNAATGRMNIYVNGALFQTAGNKNRDMTGITVATLGGNYKGSMDEVMLFNTELNAAEVATLYDSQGDLGVLFAATGFDEESDPLDDGIIRVTNSSVALFRDESWVRYDDFNFGSGASSIVVSAATVRTGDLEVRIGSPTGLLIGSMTVTDTGGWNDFQSFSASFNTSISGVEDLYLVSKGANPNAALMKLESFQID